DQRESINHLIDLCLSEQHADPDIARKCWYFPTRLARLAPTLKNASFREEREWRLISRPTMVTQMQFRKEDQCWYRSQRSNWRAGRMLTCHLSPLDPLPIWACR